LETHLQVTSLRDRPASCSLPGKNPATFTHVMYILFMNTKIDKVADEKEEGRRRRRRRRRRGRKKNNNKKKQKNRKNNNKNK